MKKKNPPSRRSPAGAGETPALRVSSESPILAALARFDAEHGVPRLVTAGRLPSVEYVPGGGPKPARG